jgi:hypothetical protein
MSARYVYSFDREQFTGPFESRDAAYRAAVVSAHELEQAPTEIFVGQQVPGDPQASDHACDIVKRMRERARAAAGEQADHYLRAVNDQDEAELDEMVEKAIVTWLTKHDRLPRFFRVKGISEYPVPSIASHPDTSAESEVTEIGESQYPAGR